MKEDLISNFKAMSDKELRAYVDEKLEMLAHMAYIADIDEILEQVETANFVLDERRNGSK